MNYTILPNGASPYVAGASANYSARTAQRIDPNLSNPYTMNWNTTIQYQFKPDWLLELSYEGSAGVGLLEGWNINTVPFNISSDPNTLNTIFKSYQNYRPFPKFGEIDQWGNFGHSTYHAGTVKLTRRFSHGFTISSFYTRSKAIDNCDNDMVVAARLITTEVWRKPAPATI